MLLLSQELHRRMDGLTKGAAQPSPAGTSGAAAEALGSSGKSSSLLGSSQMCCGSLVPDGVYGVSLGKTAAFIHKYRKVSTDGNPLLSCTLPGGT